MNDPRRNRAPTAAMLATVVAAIIAAIAAAILRAGPDAAPFAPEAGVATNRETAAALPPAQARGPAAAVGGRAADPVATQLVAAPPDATAAVVVRIVHLPPGNPRATVRLVPPHGAEAAVATALAVRMGAELVATLAAPPNRPLRLESTFDLGTEPPASGPSRDLRLTQHERCEITLEFGSLAVDLHVAGPSPKLAPLLDVTATWQDERDRASYALHLSADGTARLRCGPGALAATIALAANESCALLDGDGGQRFDPGSGRLDLHPAVPLLGVVVHDAGEIRPAAIAVEPPPADAAMRLCTAFPQRCLDIAVALHANADGLGRMWCFVEQLQRAFDVLELDPARAHRLGRLQITFSDIAIGASLPRLYAIALDGTGGTSIEGNASADLPVGHYELRWVRRGAPGPLAAQPFAILADRTTEVTVTPLPRQRWRATLRGEPSPARLLLACDGSYSFGTSRDGTFEIDLDEAPAPDMPCAIATGALPAEFPARVAAVDQERRTFEIVSELGAAQWVRIATAPLAEGPVAVHLLAPPDRPDLAGRVREPSIPLLPGQSRDGCLLEPVDGREQLTGWFTLQPGTATVMLRPEGRWVPLRVPADREVSITFVGPDGVRSVEVASRNWRGAERVFVAQGTTQVRIELVPGGTTTFGAGLAEFVAR